MQRRHDFVDFLLQNHEQWYSQSFIEGADEETGEHYIIEKPTRFTLTVAHLDHNPPNCSPSNLRALCSVCHLRYDSKQMSLKKRLKLQRSGQLSLPL